MRIDFPYPGFEPVEVPDEQLLGIYEPRSPNSCPDAAGRIAEALESPIGCPKVKELARGAKSVLIISDDYTRQTPVREIIPLLASSLADAGVDRQNIRILVALGTHRPMTESEKLAKFGEDICHRYQIINHDWQDEENLVSVGHTSSGTEVKVNRLLVESDLVIGLGQVVPHRIAGYSGGAKIVLPGVCGAAASAYTHWAGGLLPGEQVLGICDNPIRREMNEAGSLAGLRFIVNAVCDPEGRPVDVFAGDPVEAHQRASELAREVFGVKVPEPADIVIVDSFPKDIELWQAAKALYSGEIMVKPGGVIILVSPCTEGVSRSHPLILERGYRSEAQTMEEVRSGKLTNMLVASHCLRVGRLIRDRATGILVSTGISPSDALHLGFIPAATAQEALAIALGKLGCDAKISVLKHGGEALPVMG
jgi:nickel-dependent lactate racemase